MGDNVLRKTAEEIHEFDAKLKKLSEEMIDEMHKSEGIGLAAPQVGLSIRLLVTDVSPVTKGYPAQAFVNPVILETWGNSCMEEGCLSIPGIREEVNRPEEILLKYQTVEGEEKTEKFDGWMPRVLQHEMDHLDGVLFVDHLSPVKQKLVLSQYSNA